MAPQLDLRDLRYFEAIAEAGNLGRAAKKLFRTQPALTSCIDRLERTLGTVLFEKSGRGICLTAAGEALRARARLLRIASEDTVRELADLGSGVAGHVRLGVVPTVARFLLAPACRVFLKEASDVTMKAVIAQNDVLQLSLNGGDLDLIITTSATARADAELEAHAIVDDEIVVVASPSHEVFRKRVTIGDLVKYRWVLAPPPVEGRRWLDQAFLQRGLPAPAVQIETNLILILPNLIEQTGLLSFVSRRNLGRAGSRRLKEVRLKETTMRRRFDVVFKKDGYLSPAARRLVELLRKRGGELFESR